MENLIIIEDNNSRGFNTVEELVKVCINKGYYLVSEEERYDQLEKLAYANAGIYNIPILDWKKNKDESIVNKNVFILCDEITHILSLAKIGKIVILEKTDCDIFTKYIDKSNIQDNYIIVNKFADEILDKYLSENSI